MIDPKAGSNPLNVWQPDGAPEDAPRPHHADGAATSQGGRQQHVAHLQHAPRVPPRVSIVVPTCGRPQLLQRCLASLVAQQFDTHRFEIIIVDDARTIGQGAGTAAVVRDWMKLTTRHGPALHYLGPDTGSGTAHGPAAARNRGWRSASGAVIAFTDDDTQARADWLACAMPYFDCPDANGAARAGSDPVAAADAVWGRIIMPLHGPASDYELDAKGLERAEFVTANCFCRRSLLERIGGFDERFEVAWREDADLYFRLLDRAARVLHVPQAVVIHPIRPAPWGVSLSQQRKVLFDALLFKKHPLRYREKIRARPRLDYYATVAALVAALAAAASGHAALAAAAGLVWLLHTGAFCLRRLRPTVKTPAHVAEMVVTSILIPPLAVFWRIVGAARFRAGLL